jgi:hypothetical protein
MVRNLTLSFRKWTSIHKLGGKYHKENSDYFLNHPQVIFILISKFCYRHLKMNREDSNTNDDVLHTQRIKLEWLCVRFGRFI